MKSGTRQKQNTHIKKEKYEKWDKTEKKYPFKKRKVEKMGQSKK